MREVNFKSYEERIKGYLKLARQWELKRDQNPKNSKAWEFCNSQAIQCRKCAEQNRQWIDFIKEQQTHERNRSE